MPARNPGTMRSIAMLALVAMAASAASIGPTFSGPASPAKATSGPWALEIRPLADGVYAAIRTNPPGLMCDGNSLFIVDDDGVIVVDAPEASSDFLAELRKLTRAPVQVVINTHAHDDHIIGNHVYREAFPGVAIIGHESLLSYLPAAGLSNRVQMLDEAPKFAAYMRSQMEKGKSVTGSDLTKEEREAYESDFRLLDRYMAEVPKAEIVLPTIAVREKLTLHRAHRTVEILHLGRGHTSGDLVVHLPKEGIVATGDLVVWPVPLVGSGQSHVGDWSATLERIRALHPSFLVPGHGPVMRGDDAYLTLVIDLMASVKRQTEAAVALGKTLDETRKNVDLDDYRRRFAGDSSLRRLLFENYVAGPAVASAFADAGRKGGG